MANFGNFCLIFSFCLSFYALIAALVGVSQRQPRIVRSAEHAAYAATGTITLAFFSLVYLLITNDFSVTHVASTSNRALPILYKVAAIWGGHDGSMLLWVFVASIFSGIAIYQNRSRYRNMMPYVLAVLMVNLSCFILLNLFFSNPFQRLAQVFADGSARPFLPADGQGLNPILQHWAMVIHPPVQYLGFIGFVVPFAFAIAALCSKQLGDTWIRTTRRWTLLTWAFLGAGLILGGKWAYVVLGWGGYWSWDPVENSSLMPWLVSTAFLHSVIVQERKGMLKVWNIILVVFAYILSVFGTFLTRSGIVSSVHAFADSNLGKFFLIYMAGVLAASFYLIIERRDYLKSERRLDSILSRESAFLFNNLILVVACFAVFWGTMFPVFSEWVRGVKITVGPPFFNNINIPIGLLLLLLTGVGPLFAWRKTSAKSLSRSFFWPVLFSIATCTVLIFAGMRNFYAVCCLTLCVFVLITIVEEFVKGALIRIGNKGENFFTAFINLTLKNKRRYGGYIVHLSIVLMFAGFAGSAFNRETTGQMETGRQIKVGDYSLKMTGYEEGQTANYDYGKVVLEVSKNGKVIRTLKPERRVYKTGSGQSTTTVALRSTPKEDLYVVFAGMSPDRSTFEIKAYLNPLVFWIWTGAAMMIFGTIITLLPNKMSLVGSRQL
jgi:cytochrome c-type biogenesis protein CcmF